MEPNWQYHGVHLAVGTSPHAPVTWGKSPTGLKIIEDRTTGCQPTQCMYFYVERSKSPKGHIIKRLLDQRNNVLHGWDFDQLNT